MKTLEKIDIELLKEDGYTDSEINIIDYYQSVRGGNNRSYYAGPVINFLFGDDFVKYNRVTNEIEIYTQFGIIGIPLQQGFVSANRNRIECAFNIAYKIRCVFQSESFYNDFLSLISNQKLREEIEKVIDYRFDVCNSSIINLTYSGYDKILNLVDNCLDNIDIEIEKEKIGKNNCMPLDFYGVRYCVFDALKKRFNFAYTEDLNIFLYGE